MSKITEVRLTLSAYIYGIEYDLRNLIQTKIIPYVSDLNFFGDKQLIDRTTERFLKDNAGFNVEENLFSVVEYIDFSDSYTILLKNKDFLDNETFLILKQYKKALDEIAPIRNRVMHSRPLLGGDFSTVFSFMNEITLDKSKIWCKIIEIKEKIEQDPNFVLYLEIPNYSLETESVYHNLPIPDFDETGFI